MTPLEQNDLNGDVHTAARASAFHLSQGCPGAGPAPGGACASEARFVGVEESGEPLLDRSKIEELRQLDPGGAAGLIRRLVELFITRNEEVLLKPFWTSEALDVDAAARAAHSMKSSAAAMGAMRVSALCAGLERRLRQGDAVDVISYHAAIQRAYHETVAILKPILTEANQS